MTAPWPMDGEIGAAGRWRARRRARAGWIFACVAPGLLVQALESRGATPGTTADVRIGHSYQLTIGVSVECYKSSCNSSRRVDAPPEIIEDVPIVLHIVPEPGVASSEPWPLPFIVGPRFVPPISGRISLDSSLQEDARAEIERRGQTECDKLEVVDIRLEAVSPRE